jgi:biotin carboxyl carrier protein
MKQEFEISGKVNAVHLEKTEEGYSAKIGEESYDIKVKKMERGVILLDVNGEHFKVFLGENGGRYSVSVRGEEYTVEKAAQDTSQSTSVIGEKKEGNVVTAPMPGKVIKILCAEGDEVKMGQTLAIIEAMKMENNINAHRKALIKKIVAKEGDQVNLSDPIMEFESEESH